MTTLKDHSPTYLQNLADLAPGLLVLTARRGRLDDAQRLMSSVASALRRGEKIDTALAEFVAELLDALLADPARLGAVLYGKRGPGAPPRGGSERMYVGAYVDAYMRSGIPEEDGYATDTWDGEGAITRARRLCAEGGISVTHGQARRGMKEFRKWRRRHHANKVEAKRRMDAFFDEQERSG